MNVKRSNAPTMRNEPFQVRLLKDSTQNPFKHFAAEEAILRLVEEGLSPATLRIRKFDPSVWIGVHQYVEEDVDVDYCIKNNIPIVRRPNPGGAVYQDAGSFCFSFFFKPQTFFQHLGIKDSLELYKWFGKVIIETCKKFGIVAKNSGRNDVTIDNKKIYGSAQNQFHDAFAHSGTFLVNVNIEQMVSTLKPSKLKFIDKGYTNVKDRVINLSSIVGRVIDLDEVIDVLVAKIRLIFNLQYNPIENDFTNEEHNLITDLYLNKYSKKDWTFRYKPTTETLVSKKTDHGILTLGLELSEKVIKKFTISGDFLLPNKDALTELVSNIQDKTLNEVTKLILESSLPLGFKNSLIDLLNDLELN